MKATATINQVELEQKAIDSMISYEKGFITYSEMEKAVSDVLRYYGSREGHRRIVLKGWIIKTIYALDSVQLKDLDRITLEYLNEY